MPATRIAAADLGFPAFAAGEAQSGEPFSLSSHVRAREALEFGLNIREPGFNIFVLGEDRSGRMTATLEFLEAAVAHGPPPDDWIYVNNFHEPHRPEPFRLPAGHGARFAADMTVLIAELRVALARTFKSEEFQAAVRREGEDMGAEVTSRMESLRREARAIGLDIVKTPQGPAVVAAQPADAGAAPVPRARPSEDQVADMVQRVADVTVWAAHRQSEFAEWVEGVERHAAEQAIGELFAELAADYAHVSGLAAWLADARHDVLDSLALFRAGDDGAPGMASPERRYAVNVLVDHTRDAHPSVVVEPNPTFRNVFGRIEYRQAAGVLETDFTLVRAGALHNANGGILVLRADAVAADRSIWEFLKAALRDRAVAVEEVLGGAPVPIAGAPRPKPIPLDVKVVLVGTPHWYYTFFSVDPEFQTYFKIKADIDPDMEASPENVDAYAGLIRRMAREHGGAVCDGGAISRLLGVAARRAAHRKKLSSQFEHIDDLVAEAIQHGGAGSPCAITAEAVNAALGGRRRRNARIEDRLHESIARGTVMIDVEGTVVGQVNALVVRDLGDYQFGTPARVTARASVGRRGVINIEREAALGGPIQQKAAMVLQGFLGGHFARRLPLSFNVSITFEQSYGGVEGDSASVAELLAILSDLAEAPLRQDLAVTGSLNQLGLTQAVGGVHHKIEGFFRTCRDAGPLTGSQGVVIPAANAVNLVLRDEVVEAVRAGRFHAWSAERFEDAAELFTGIPAGTMDAHGRYPPESLYGRVTAKLEEFDRILHERERRGG